MKKLLFENTFIQLFLWETPYIIEAFWKDATVDMVDADFKETIQVLWKNLAEHKPIGLLADTRNFGFVITPDLQEWYGENITANMGKDTKKVAMLVSLGLIEQISIKQTIEEDNKTGFQTNYFSSIEKALAWLVI